MAPPERTIAFTSYWIQVVGIASGVLSIAAAVKISEHLAITVDQYQWVILLKSSMYALSMFFASILSDCLGRKKTAIMVTMLLLISSIMFLSTQTLPLWLFAEVLSGLALGATAMLSRLLVSDIAEGDRLKAQLSSRTSFSQVLLTSMPLLSGMFVWYGHWQWIYAINALLAFSLLCLLLIIPETRPHSNAPIAATSLAK